MPRSFETGNYIADTKLQNELFGPPPTLEETARKAFADVREREVTRRGPSGPAALCQARPGGARPDQARPGFIWPGLAEPGMAWHHLAARHAETTTSRRSDPRELQLAPDEAGHVVFDLFELRGDAWLQRGGVAVFLEEACGAAFVEVSGDSGAAGGACGDGDFHGEGFRFDLDDLHFAFEDVADVVQDGAHAGDDVVAFLLERAAVADLVELAGCASFVGLAFVGEDDAGFRELLADDRQCQLRPPR